MGEDLDGEYRAPLPAPKELEGSPLGRMHELTVWRQNKYKLSPVYRFLFYGIIAFIVISLVFLGALWGGNYIAEKKYKERLKLEEEVSQFIEAGEWKRFIDEHLELEKELNDWLNAPIGEKGPLLP
jgi:hypothetical protein